MSQSRSAHRLPGIFSQYKGGIEQQQHTRIAVISERSGDGGLAEVDQGQEGGLVERLRRTGAEGRREDLKAAQAVDNVWW